MIFWGLMDFIFGGCLLELHGIVLKEVGDYQNPEP